MSARVPPLSAVMLGLLTLGLAGCGEPEGADRGFPHSPPTPQPRNLLALPGPSSWQGTLPCADCAGIATTLTLEPDGSFLRQGAYLGTGGGGDTILTEFGRWVLEPSTSRVRLFSSAEAPSYYAVQADGALTQLDLEGQPITGSLDYTLRAANDAPSITHPARVVVAFTYYADAATAVECRSGLAWPVDMSAEYPALERAYVASGRTGGRPLVVRLRAHLDDRPAMEGDGLARALVVDSLLAVNAEDGCAALRQQDSIASGSWQLVALSDALGAALSIPSEPRVTFSWDRAEGRFVGNSGCNRYAARGTLRGTTLGAGPAMGTKMACVSGASSALESRFLQVLAGGPALWFEVDTLIWAVGPAPVARFVRE